MDLVLSLVLIIITFVNLMRQRENIIPYIIVYNVIFDVFNYTFDSTSGIIAMGRALLLYTTAFFFYKKKGFKVRPVNIFILIFLLFTFFLCFFSNDFNESIRTYLRVSSYFIYFDLIYSYYLDKRHDPKKYFKSFSLVLVTYIVYTIAANIFKLGTMYSSKQDTDDSFQTGNIIGDFLLQFSFSVLLIPLIFFYNNDKKYRIFYILCSCITIPLLLISTRRTSVLIIVVGYVIFLFFYKNKSAAVLYSLLFSFVASLFILNFSDTIVKRFEARADRLEVNSFEAEGRTMEYFVVSDLIFSFKDPLHSLFGKDIYAERGVLKTFYSERHLHTDYGKLLHGTGIIGFILYILFIYTLVVTAFKQKRFKIHGDQYALHFSSILMLIGCKVILSYTGGFHVISYNAMVFGTIGLILAIQKRTHQENLIQNSILRNQTTQRNEARLHS